MPSACSRWPASFVRSRSIGLAWCYQQWERCLMDGPNYHMLHSVVDGWLPAQASCQGSDEVSSCSIRQISGSFCTHLPVSWSLSTYCCACRLPICCFKLDKRPLLGIPGPSSPSHRCSEPLTALHAYCTCRHKRRLAHADHIASACLWSGQCNNMHVPALTAAKRTAWNHQYIV